ncbi:hypothetical protein GF326_06590 [Candidatus Bathyarchaeota archaeon]|nr:hypothetical protein [Candidatus Bathyarchaeota archaeon]
MNLKIPIDGLLKFITGIAGKLNFKRGTEQIAVKILREIKKNAFVGKDPRGFAASALYVSCNSNDDR